MRHFHFGIHTNVRTTIHRYIIELLFVFQPADKKKFPYGGMNVNRPVTPPRGGNQKKGKK